MRRIEAVRSLLPIVFILLAVAAGCDRKCPAPAATTPAPDSSASADEEKVEKIKLEQSSSGGVLILDEGDTGDTQATGADDGLSGKKKPRVDYPPFRDQHVKLYVDNINSAFPEAVRMASASGAQVIDYAIKGFENMGPNEKTLVFDYRTFRPYLKKISALGRVEHLPIERSDFVTVRLTVLSEEGGK